MRTQTFYQWLTRETASSRFALIRLYEECDRLLYAEAPPLRKKYMDAIGILEEPVLRAELEVSLLYRKIELIQAAINRREAPDPAAIEAQLEAEKERQISELESEDLTLNELPQLSENQAQTMQRQYKEIIETFHPVLNPGSAGTQKELYQKAVEAYKMQDAAEMQLIYDMLFAPEDQNSDLVYELREVKEMADKQKSERKEYKDTASVLSTDYLLAKKLYPCFVPLEEDGVFLDMLHTYDAQRQEMEKKIARIKAGFPFNARETLDSRAKTEEYLTELRFRARRCEAEKSDLEKQIAAMLEGFSNG